MLTRLSTLIALSIGGVSSVAWAASPSVNPMSEQSVVAGETLAVRVSGWDPDGGVPGLYLINMPEGSSFDDNGDGTRTFNWTPSVEDIGEYTFTVIASDAQADGLMSSGALFVNVIDFDEFDDFDDEPEILDATETTLTSVDSRGFYNLDTISEDTHYALSIVDDVDVGFGGSDDLIFGAGGGKLSVYTDFESESFAKNDEITGSGQFSWSSQSRVSTDDRHVAVMASAYEPIIVYENIADVWVEESRLALPPSAGTPQRYTAEVAMSGQTVVAGHPVDDNVLVGTRLAGSGAVRVYDNNSSGWSNTAVITAPNADEHDQFGSAVAIDGDIMVVSAISEGGAGRGNNADMFNNDFKPEFPYYNSFGSSGAVYVYERMLGSWFNTAYLKASDNTATLQFGWEVAIDGDKIVVGAPGRNIDTSLDYVDFYGNPIDENEGAVYVFEKNSMGAWEETQIIESVDAETKFGLYLSAKNDAVAVGSAVAASLFAFQDDQWNNLWFGRYAPHSVALGNDALAIGTNEGLRILTAGEFVYADEGDDVDTTRSSELAAPTFFGSHFNDGVYSKTIEAGEEAAVVVSARQIDHVPGLFMEYSELGGTFEDNLDGTRTFRWQSSEIDGGVFSFNVVATNALDASVRSTALIEIVIRD